MEITTLIFLSSGLFLGWSLGANDAANVFGTAVGSRMVRFSTAALICSGFVLLGATISGAGAAHTLGKLGAVDAIAGSFMVAFAAAFTVMWMTKLGLPVSTSQAVVGAIIGWNLFSGSITDLNTLWKILATWVACPILGAFFGALIYPITKRVVDRSKTHLLRIDSYTRWALILAGAFGSYALGANNIANVMGVFISSSPFTDFKVGDLFQVTAVQQLFFLGAIAIGVGVYTYSKRVMLTVGGGIIPLTPVAAWVVVIAHSIVLFLFSSVGLEHFLASNGLPTIPLVPVSSSQAVVGAVIGIGLLQSARNIKWSVLRRISSGWISTPVISAAISFTFLFFLQNVFNQTVNQDVSYNLTQPVMQRLADEGYDTAPIQKMLNHEYPTATAFRDALRQHATIEYGREIDLIDIAKVSPVKVDGGQFAVVAKAELLNSDQFGVLKALEGRTFDYSWMLAKALAQKSPAWRFQERTKLNKIYNKDLQAKLDFVTRTFAIRQGV